MSRTAELFAKLTASGINVDHVPGGYKTLTAHDIAAAMTGLETRAMLVVLAKYAGDADARHSLYNWVWSEAARRDQIERWNGTQAYIDALAAVALHIAIDEPKCRACRGSGLNARYQPCKRCEGTGNDSSNGMKVVKDAGAGQINKANWYRRWIHRVPPLVEQLQEWESRAIRSVKNQLREPLDRVDA